MTTPAKPASPAKPAPNPTSGNVPISADQSSPKDPTPGQPLPPPVEYPSVQEELGYCVLDGKGIPAVPPVSEKPEPGIDFITVRWVKDKNDTIHTLTGAMLVNGMNPERQAPPLPEGETNVTKVPEPAKKAA